MTAQFSIREADPQIVARLAHDLGLPRFIATTLVARGITTVRAAKRFLNPSLDRDWRNPLEIPGLAEVADGLINAIREKKRIIVFGDFDLDGISATTVLTRGLRALGACAFPFIPRRFEEGYGITAAAFERARALEPDVIVTVDCGIACKSEVADILKAGVEVYITDHHEAADLVPEGVPVADPKMADDCPSAILAGVGVALKLVQVLGSRLGFPHLWRSYTDFATLGTVADLMPMRDENRALVADGLTRMNTNPRPCIAALLATTGQAGKPLSATNLSFSLIPRLNAAGRMGAADMAAELLLCSDPEAAERMAKELCALNRERQNVEQEIYTQAEEMIGQMPDRQRSALVLESSRWHQGVVGIVASRLSEKYSRPSFMIHLNGSTGKGSCRSWGGFNLFAALENCKDLLLGFGGHELAAGFTIDRDNIPAFRDRMNEYARSYCNGRPPEPALEVDVAIAYPAAVTLEELEALSALEPYGSGNARPVFCLLGATLLRTQNVGQNRHLKLRLGKGCAQFDGIFFSTVAERCGCAVGDRVDAAFYLQINEFRGSRTVQLQMVDIRPSLCASGREQEALTLAHHIAGGGVPPLRDARRALPTRQQFAAAWRFLERAVPEEGLTADTLPLLRHMASELGGVEPFLRAAMCVAVFRERGLLDWQETEHTITLHLHRGCRVSLEHSPLMAALAYHDSEKGGGAQ